MVMLAGLSEGANGVEPNASTPPRSLPDASPTPPRRADASPTATASASTPTESPPAAAPTAASTPAVSFTQKRRGRKLDGKPTSVVGANLEA